MGLSALGIGLKVRLGLLLFELFTTLVKNGLSSGLARIGLVLAGFTRRASGLSFRRWVAALPEDVVSFTGLVGLLVTGLVGLLVTGLVGLLVAGLVGVLVAGLVGVLMTGLVDLLVAGLDILVVRQVYLVATTLVVLAGLGPALVTSVVVGLVDKSGI